ncbi:MAG: TonB family protein [Deltaproteobacteria bacterium]|nr:TonB family protein [Deltaproteobacteria bacterium]
MRMVFLSLSLHTLLFSVVVSHWGHWGKEKVFNPIMVDLVSLPTQAPAGRVTKPSEPATSSAVKEVKEAVAKQRPTPKMESPKTPTPSKTRAEDPASRLRSAISDIQQRVGVSGSGGGSIADAYHAELYEHMKRFWHMPADMALKAKRNDLQTEMLVRWRRDGVIISFKIEKGSGDVAFDESVTRAVRGASPLPSIPSSVAGKEKEVVFRFSAKDY